MDGNGQDGLRDRRDGLLPKHGGFRKLKSFQVAQLAYDFTVVFCDRFVDRRSRTHDQMVQAARSGVQNIAEGSVASGTSKKMELKLTNVARASLEELRLDYEDFLRHRGLPLWAPDDPRRHELVARRCGAAGEVVDWLREVRNRHGRDRHDGHDGGPAPSVSPIPSIESMESTPSTPSSASQPRPSYEELAANAGHVLVGVAMALLDRQLAAQAEAFERDGGFTERLYRTRSRKRGR
jgi:four helix bundle suffix protein